MSNAQFKSIFIDTKKWTFWTKNQLFTSTLCLSCYSLDTSNSALAKKKSEEDRGEDVKVVGRWSQCLKITEKSLISTSRATELRVHFEWTKVH